MGARTCPRIKPGEAEAFWPLRLDINLYLQRKEPAA